MCLAEVIAQFLMKLVPLIIYLKAMQTFKINLLFILKKNLANAKTLKYLYVLKTIKLLNN